MPLTNLARLFLAFPGSIRPADPDYTRCDPHYGQDLVGDACRVAVSKMPSLPRGVQAEWAVNHRQAITGWSRGSSYNLPLTITHGELSTRTTYYLFVGVASDLSGR